MILALQMASPTKTRHFHGQHLTVIGVPFILHVTVLKIEMQTVRNLRRMEVSEPYRVSRRLEP